METNGYYHTYYKNRKITLKVKYEIASDFQTLLDANKSDILISSRKKQTYISFSLWNKNGAFDTPFFDALTRLKIDYVKDYLEWQYLDNHGLL